MRAPLACLVCSLLAGCAAEALGGPECSEPLPWVYLFTTSGRLARERIEVPVVEELATLRCPGAGVPRSLAVDRSGVAWVGFGDAGLRRVDVADRLARCHPTEVAVSEDFGLAFVAGSSGETLYAADRIEPRLLRLTDAGIFEPVAPLAGPAWLAGTPSGELWALVPEAGVIVQLDPETGAVRVEHAIPTDALPAAGPLAFVALGDRLYVLAGSGALRFDPRTGAIFGITSGLGAIAAAGGTTCAGSL